MNSDKHPKADIIAGPNGAGKTTFATKFLPRLTDFWAIYDNSTNAPNLIAYKEYDKLEIIDHEIFNRMSKEMEK